MVTRGRGKEGGLLVCCATHLLHPALKDCRVHAPEDDSMKVCCKGGPRPGEVKIPLSTRGAPSLILPSAPTPAHKPPGYFPPPVSASIFHPTQMTSAHASLRTWFGDLFSDFPDLPCDGMAIASQAPTGHYLYFCQSTDNPVCHTLNPKRQRLPCLCL